MAVDRLTQLSRRYNAICVECQTRNEKLIEVYWRAIFAHRIFEYYENYVSSSDVWRDDVRLNARTNK